MDTGSAPGGEPERAHIEPTGFAAGDLPLPPSAAGASAPRPGGPPAAPPFDPIPPSPSAGARPEEEEAKEWAEETAAYLGEPAPEDEPPLLDLDLTRSSDHPTKGSAAGTPSAYHLPPLAERGRVEDVASRLERIARALRERGPAGPLAEEGADALNALVTGYLLGFSDSETKRESPPAD
jgi:hypothetical protein